VASLLFPDEAFDHEAICERLRVEGR
jgi:hypothetical protein